jgi:hypothetical protein
MSSKQSMWLGGQRLQHEHLLALSLGTRRSSIDRRSGLKANATNQRVSKFFEGTL